MSYTQYRCPDDEEPSLDQLENGTAAAARKITDVIADLYDGIEVGIRTCKGRIEAIAQRLRRSLAGKATAIRKRLEPVLDTIDLNLTSAIGAAASQLARLQAAIDLGIVPKPIASAQSTQQTGQQLGATAQDLSPVTSQPVLCPAPVIQVQVQPPAVYIVPSGLPSSLAVPTPIGGLSLEVVQQLLRQVLPVTTIGRSAAEQFELQAAPIPEGDETAQLAPVQVVQPLCLTDFTGLVATAPTLATIPAGAKAGNCGAYASEGGRFLLDEALARMEPVGPLLAAVQADDWYSRLYPNGSYPDQPVQSPASLEADTIQADRLAALMQEEQ